MADAQLPDQRTPRATKFWGRQLEMLMNGLRQALTCPELRKEWAALEAIFTRWHQEGPPEDDEARQVGKLLDALGHHVEDAAPTLAHALGANLREFLFDQIAAQVGVPGALEQGAKFKRLLPDNPIMKRADGSFVGLERAEKRHLLEWWNLLASYRPEGRRGRPPKLKGARTAWTAPAQDPELAERAFEMHQDGKKPTEIARLLLPKPRPAAQAERERQRGQVRRLIEAGRRRAYRKKPVLA